MKTIPRSARTRAQYSGDMPIFKGSSHRLGRSLPQALGSGEWRKAWELVEGRGNDQKESLGDARMGLEADAEFNLLWRFDRKRLIERLEKSLLNN